MEYKNSAAREAIDEWIHDERYRAILKRRLCDKATFDKLAGEFDMSDRQLRRIVKKLEDEVFRHM